MEKLKAYDSGEEDEKADASPALSPTGTGIGTGTGTGIAKVGGVIPVESAPDVVVSSAQNVGAEGSGAVSVSSGGQAKVKGKLNHLNGTVEESYANTCKFEEQYHKFNTTGVVLDPSGNREVASTRFAPSDSVPPSVRKKELKLKRQKAGDPSQGSYMGPWASYEGPQAETEDKCDLTEEQKEILRKLEEKRQKKLEEAKETDTKPVLVEGKSIFHGNLARDYQGRSYLEPPADLKLGKHQNYIPRKWVHTWLGHSKAVQCIRVFPKYGHFLLSGSHDAHIKLWDVATNRKCIRTYMGHGESVRDLCFSNNGKVFLSASYDKNVVLWDTEYGKIIRAFTNRKIPFCVKFHPDDSKQNVFLVGSQAKKILQYDTNSGEIVQQYEEHIGSVNTITFLDNNRKFVSTGDDKKVFLWDFGIPVVVKHISEPDMHAIPAAAAHPNLKYMVGQSMDNKIVVYESKSTFRLSRKKKFTGHQNAGYAIGLSFSPDGKFLASGDSEGKLWFWDWKTAKVYRTMKVHDSVCIDVQWHPIDPSRMFTCSWDGTIKMWD